MTAGTGPFRAGWSAGRLVGWPIVRVRKQAPGHARAATRSPVRNDFGDPACDLAIDFTLMSARCRAVFRARLGVDDATWTRGRGWALTTGLNAYTAYAAVNPRVAAQTTRQITEALIADRPRGLRPTYGRPRRQCTRRRPATRISTGRRAS